MTVCNAMGFLHQGQVYESQGKNDAIFLLLIVCRLIQIQSRRSEFIGILLGWNLFL